MNNLSVARVEMSAPDLAPGNRSGTVRSEIIIMPETSLSKSTRMDDLHDISHLKMIPDGSSTNRILQVGRVVVR